MDSPRDRRLRSDFRAMTQLKAESSIVDFKAYGNPPERYLVSIKGAGLRREDPGTNQVRAGVLDFHEVEIYLGADYPRNRPQLQWKTEIFHPNISGTGLVCLGGYSTHWVPSLNIDELVEMLWDMVRFSNYDVKSPYNLVAARWVASQTQFAFPLDTRPVRDKGPAPEPEAAKPPAAAPATPVARPPAAKPTAKTPAKAHDQGVAAQRSDVAATRTPARPAPRLAPEQDILFLDADAAPPAPPGKQGPPKPTPPGDDEIHIIE